MVTALAVIQDGKAFSVAHGATIIKVRLYGEVSEDRLKHELQIAQHRAEQLSAAWPAVRKEQ